MTNGNDFEFEQMNDEQLANAAKRIAELTTQRIVRNAQSDGELLTGLKAEARGDLTPFERLSIGNQINELEGKLNDTTK